MVTNDLAAALAASEARAEAAESQAAELRARCDALEADVTVRDGLLTLAHKQVDDLFERYEALAAKTVAAIGALLPPTINSSDSLQETYSNEPDTELAWHWIDRYACGIDPEPQFDRIADALAGREGEQ